MTSSLSILGLFLEGLLSFFTPCVLPLVPLYIGYLTSGIQDIESPKKRRIETILRTFFFVLGISTVFFLAGLGSAALRQLFTNNTVYFHLFGGFLFIIFGLFALGVIDIPFLQKERKVLYQAKGKMNYLQAYLLGFFFSFAWSPCVGPLLASAIMAASSASSGALGWLYIGAYTLGFITIFIIIGLFTEEVLSFLKKNRNIVRYTKWIGGVVVVAMGVYMLFQGTKTIEQLKNHQNTTITENSEISESIAEGKEETDAVDMATVNFTLMNQDGKSVSLTDYRGKKVVVTFFGTWCHYCNEELPYLQELHDTREDFKVLLIATPNLGREGDKDYILNYLKEKDITIEVLFDEDYSIVQGYGVSGFPSTFLFQSNGEVLGYIPGYLPAETMDQIIETMQ